MKESKPEVGGSSSVVQLRRKQILKSQAMSKSMAQSERQSHSGVNFLYFNLKSAMKLASEKGVDFQKQPKTKSDFMKQFECDAEKLRQ